MTRIALKPRHFPWYDYSRYTFSLGLSVGHASCFPAIPPRSMTRARGRWWSGAGCASRRAPRGRKSRPSSRRASRSLADIVRVVEYVTPEGIERYAEAVAVRAELFGGNRPALNTVVVNRLLRPQALIEIEVEAEPDEAPPPSPIADGPPRGRRRESPTGWFIFLRSCRSTMRVRCQRRAIRSRRRARYTNAPRRVLDGLGLGMDRVVKTVDYLTPAALPNYRHTGDVRREFLGPVYPAATGIIMKRVAHRDALIQVDFIASRRQPAAVNPGMGALCGVDLQSGGARRRYALCRRAHGARSK